MGFRHLAGSSERGLTGLLQAWGGGDREAGEEVLPLVYDELRRQAVRCLRGERRGHTLRPTALVNEAYLRLAGAKEEAWPNRGVFFATAATMMRHILVDHARRRGASKRAGSWCRITLDEGLVLEAPRDVDVLALDEALCVLAGLDAQKARVVEMRFFGGLTLEETRRRWECRRRPCRGDGAWPVPGSSGG